MRQEVVLLADDMGLGKTIQAIAALRILVASGEIRRALVVTPAALLVQWRRELYDWAPELSALRIEGPLSARRGLWATDRRVMLASYETVRSDAAWAGAQTWDVVILDEAQRIKNREAAISQVCKRLPRRRAWALTGTPLENREDDLASILEFVRPNPDGQRLPALRMGFSLLSMHADRQLRRRKQDVLADLPPKTLVRVPLELTRAQRHTYDEAERCGRGYLQALGERATTVNVLELIAQLKQICNFCPQSGSSIKLLDLRRRLETLRASGHRALVFSQWVSEACGVGRLVQELDDYDPVAYSGQLSSPVRQARIDRFVRDPRHGVLVLSLRAGGQGLNLQAATYVFHFDRWWNPAVENQASDRVHRIGQRHPVTVYAYTCVATIEERIEQILEQKRRLFYMLVDQVSFDVRRLLTAEELFGLFDLHAPSGARRPGRGIDRRPLESRVREVLRRGGWPEVQAEGEGHLVARRLDELGGECVATVLCLTRWEPAALAGDRPALIVCPSGLPSEVAAALAEEGVAVLDEHGLAVLEDAVEATTPARLPAP